MTEEVISVGLYWVWRANVAPKNSKMHTLRVLQIDGFSFLFDAAEITGIIQVIKETRL